MARRVSRRRRSLPRRLAGWLARTIVAFVLISLVWVLLYRFVPPPLTVTQVGDLIDGDGVRRDWLAIERIDRDMVRAVIAGEDSKFCSHGGFDRQAIEAAMRRNARRDGVVRGGSTISQQTAKNAFLWQGGGYFRKGLEAWFTLLIETLWSKRRIIEVYLNVAETGIGTYGVNAGARRYFGHDATRLAPSEAARIAAVLPLPQHRAAIAPTGFTRRYGNMISARMGVVRRDELDFCVYENDPARSAADRPEPRPASRPAPDPRPAALPVEPEPTPATPAKAVEDPPGDMEDPIAAPAPSEPPLDINGM